MAHQGKKTTPTPADMPLVHPPAAGLAVGAEEHGVCGPADRESQPLQPFGAFPCAWHRLADWLTPWRLTTGVMESTGVSWIPRWQRLETRGCAVALVNARHVKHVPGRPQTDRFACRWRQTFHRDGVLAPSCRPPEQRCQRRRRLRHRDPLCQRRGKPRQPRQKALEQMPRPLPHVLSAVTGVTGMRLRRAIVAGEREPHPFAQSRASRRKARPEPLAQALAGDDRSAPLCTLTHSLALEAFPPQHIADGAQAIARVLSPGATRVDPAPPPLPPPTTTPRHPHRHAPACALRTPLSRIPGVDLTHVPG